MKKQLLSLIVLFTIISYANESRAQLNTSFGLRVGVNIASLADSKQEVDSPRIGLLAGLYGRVQIPGTPVSVQPEVLYAQKGAEINNVEIKRSYIEVPVLVRVDISTHGSLSPHVLAGPYFGFKLNAETDPASDPPIDEFTNNNDFGLTFGAGVDINRISVGIRYSLGLQEVLENEEERNQAISIVAGYGF